MKIQAIIPAAGLGSRLGNLTKDIPKCMIEVNGQTLISRQLEIIEDLNFSRIIIITGHKADLLKKHIKSLKLKTEVIFLHNKNYAQTNNIVSVSLASNFMQQCDSVLIESDLIFEPRLLQNLLNSRANKVVVSEYQNYMDGTTVIFKNGKIEFGNFTTENSNQIFKTVNIYYFTNSFVKQVYGPLLKIYLDQGLADSYYETPLSLVGNINIGLIEPMVTTDKWYEIDDVNDLDIASVLFSENELETVHSRYGGFWRFPEKKDFTFLSNPYFPTKELMKEIEVELPNLIHHYPSNRSVNRALLAALLNIDENYVLPLNGAAEIIPDFLNSFDRQFILNDTFREYENRAKNVKIISDLNEISPTKKDLVVIVNPNNPDGLIHRKESLISALEKHREASFLIDESFMDFARDKASATLQENDMLRDFKNLFILRSIGKTHGVGGLRLGALIGSRASDFEKTLPIWNINSIAEYFLQRYKKYEKRYHESVEQVKEQRDYLEQEIPKYLNVKMNESNGNFIFFQYLDDDYNQLASHLYKKGCIIKKIIKGNGKVFFRIAVRSLFDNQILINAISDF